MTSKKRGNQEVPEPVADDGDVEIVSVDAVGEDGQLLQDESSAEPLADEIELSLEDDADEPEESESAGALRERWLRARADLENYRRRVQRERAGVEDRARAAVITELLPVLDDFDRAVESLSADAGAREGVELIARTMREALARFGLVAIETEGQTFDPEVHEAGAAEVNPEVPPQTILGDLRRGYRMGDRLLRPSLVRVAVAAENGETE